MRIVQQYGVTENANGTLDILSGDSRELVAIREHPDPAVRERIEQAIVEFFTAPEVESEYDLVMFDTGPNESALTRGVVQASSHVIIPVELEQQCIDGLSAMTGMTLDEPTAQRIPPARHDRGRARRHVAVMTTPT